MNRMAGLLVALLATASIALGTPLCCLVGVGCCGTKTTVQPKTKRDCCSHCRRKQPGTPTPKPCQDKKTCTCKHDVTNRAAAAAHVPLVAVFDVPAVVLPERSAADVTATSHRALPLAPVRASRPLLL